MTINPTETVVFLVRHGKAGDRERWTRPDAERPLTPAGMRQAELLPALLEPHGVRRSVEVRSSRYLRCRQTAEPLARRLGLTVVDDDVLVEGTPLDAVLDRLQRTPDAVWCSHGDVIADTVMWLDRSGLLGGQEPRWSKGSTWRLRLIAGEVVGADHLAAP